MDSSTNVSTTNSDGKKNSKPIMEKRRRARINASLAELKSLLLDAIQREGTRHSKMEKADILELAVRHLKEIQSQPGSSNPSASIFSKYVMGFQACAAEVSKYLATDGKEDLNLKTKLLDHLSNCLADDDGPFMSSNNNTISSTSSSIISLDDTGREDLHSTDSPSSSCGFRQSQFSTSSSPGKTPHLSSISIDTNNNTKNQNIVSSSTQLSSKLLPLSSSSSSSSSSTNVGSIPLRFPLDDALKQPMDQCFPHLNTHDRHNNTIRELMIVKTRSEDDDHDDEDSGNDGANSSNVTLNDCDRTGVSFMEIKNKNSINGHTVEGMENCNNDQINVIKGDPFPQDLNVSTASKPITIFQPNMPSLPVSTIPIHQQPLIYQPLAHAQNIQQQQHLLPQHQETTEALKEQKPMDQIFIGSMKTFPCVGPNVQVFPTAQANSNEIAFVLPANILSTGSIPKLYIPVLTQNTLQTPTTIITPQVSQTNQSVPPTQQQLDTVKFISQPQQQLLPITITGDIIQRGPDTLTYENSNGTKCLSLINHNLHSTLDSRLPVEMSQISRNRHQEEHKEVLPQRSNERSTSLLAHNHVPVNIISQISTSQATEISDNNTRSRLSSSFSCETGSGTSNFGLIPQLQKSQPAIQDEAELPQQQQQQPLITLSHITNKTDQKDTFHLVSYTPHNPSATSSQCIQEALQSSENISYVNASPQSLLPSISHSKQNNTIYTNPIFPASVITTKNAHDDSDNDNTSFSRVNDNYDSHHSSSIVDVTRFRKRTMSPSDDQVMECHKRQKGNNIEFRYTKQSASCVLDLSKPGSRVDVDLTPVQKDHDNITRTFQSRERHNLANLNVYNALELETTHAHIETIDSSKGSLFRPW